MHAPPMAPLHILTLQHCFMSQEQLKSRSCSHLVQVWKCTISLPKCENLAATLALGTTQQPTQPNFHTDWTFET